jgi:hypothetical protein
MCLGRWCACSCSSNEVRFMSRCSIPLASFSPISRRVGPCACGSTPSAPLVSLALFELRSFHVALLHSTRFVLTLSRVVYSLRLRLHSPLRSGSRVASVVAPAAPLPPLRSWPVSRFYHIFHKSLPISREIRAEAERLESQTQRAKRRESRNGVREWHEAYEWNRNEMEVQRMCEMERHRDVQLVMVITLFFCFSAAAAAASCFSLSTCARIFCCSGVKEQPIFSI